MELEGKDINLSNDVNRINGIYKDLVQELYDIIYGREIFRYGDNETVSNFQERLQKLLAFESEQLDIRYNIFRSYKNNASIY